VIFHYWLGSERRGLRDRVQFLLFPFVGMVSTLWLMVSLDHLAIILGLSWLTLGLTYLGWLTGGFRRQPPELSFEEA
jgi:hypothetical protein